MTTDKLSRAFAFYRVWLHQKGLVPATYYPGPSPTDPSHECHIAYMCDEATKEGTGLIALGEIEKAMRWLGFIQGVLVTRKLFTLDEIMRHGMLDEVSS